MRLMSIPVTFGLLALAGCAAPLRTATSQESRYDASLPRLITVTMQTTAGDIVIELDHDRAPISVENFLRYADRGDYNGTIFHRVVPGFVVQGGGHTMALEELKGDRPIKNEWKNGLKNTRGTIGMARDTDPDTATREFYFNVNNNARLDTAREKTGNAGYAVFGHVTSGMDILDEMVKADTYSSKELDLANIPMRPVIITSVRR